LGMTNLQEAKLAREAEICYATYAMITDYDCWHEEEEDVSVEAVIQILMQNAETAQKAIVGVVQRLQESSGQSDCPCRNALANALITDPSVVPKKTLDRLEPLVGRYLDRDKAES
ncbi:MAG: S-methyl-5'-thioadenosine phosphorylase, partial [Acidobacteriota bacterium]